MKVTVVVRAIIPLFLLILLAAILLGCGASGSDCGKVIGYNIFPTDATADHAGIPPANQVVYNATEKYAVGDNCAMPAYVRLVPNLAWSSSNNSVATVALAPDGVNATATCVSASSTPVTITAALPSSNLSGNATLTCH